MNTYRSEETGILFGALSKAQGLYKPLIVNQDSTGGKFANLTAILDAVREALATNGLAFYQYVDLLDQGSGASLLWTVLGHESGQYISSCSRITIAHTLRETMNGIEGFKRLNATLILGIAPSSNDPLLFDDNGVEEFDNKLLENIRKPEKKVPSDLAEKITKEQYQDLVHELEGHEEIAKGILRFYGNIVSLSDIPKSEFYTVQDKIRRIKKTHDEYTRNK